MARYVGIGKETTFKTKATPDMFIDMVSYDITGEKGALLGETGAYRALRDVWVGAVIVRGSFEHIFDANSAARLLYLGLGSVTTTPDDAVSPVAYKHELTPAESIPSATLELGHEGSEVRFILGTGISRLEIGAVAREVVMCTAEIIGAREELAAPSTPTFDHILPFIFGRADVLRAGTSIKTNCQAFRLTIENSIPDDAHVLGSLELPKLHLQGLSIEGEIEWQFSDYSEYKRFLGSTTATTFLDTHESFSLKLSLKGGSTGSTVTGYGDYLCEIELPKCYYLESGVPVARRDRIVQSIRFRAVHDPTSGYPIKATVINKKSAP